jgi:hypothetical protein
MILRASVGSTEFAPVSSDRRAQDEVIVDDQADFLGRPPLGLRRLGDGLSFHLNGQAQATKFDWPGASPLSCSGGKMHPPEVPEGEPDHHLGRVAFPLVEEHIAGRSAEGMLDPRVEISQVELGVSRGEALRHGKRHGAS